MGDVRPPGTAGAQSARTANVAGRQRPLAFAAIGVACAVLLAVASPVSSQGTAPPLHLAQPMRTVALQVTVAPTLSTRAAARMTLDIRVGPADALPKNCFVRVRGLPPAVSLSEGYATAPGAWAVPLYALGSLQMIVPAGVAGRTEVSVSLVSEDGAVLAEARSVLTVEPPAQAAPKQEKAEAKAPARPQAPIMSPSEREAAERFVARGERELEQGQIAIARQFFLRAAQAGYGPGALLLAATYDPRELARWRAHGVQPNLAEARKWYERARELGAPEAEERLARLGGG
jgi:hypothetical protein